MLGEFWYNKNYCHWAWGGLFFLIFTIWIHVQLAVAMNIWRKEFFDLMQNALTYQSSPDEGYAIFVNKLISLKYITSGFSNLYRPSFIEIVLPYIGMAILTRWFSRLFGFQWREALTFSYIHKWRYVINEVEGASQRIQEDCNRWARIIESLGMQCIRSILTLIAFIPILWEYSDRIGIRMLQSFDGALVWVCLTASLGGMIISWFISWQLPDLEYNNQRVEAAFRKDLVLGEDNKTYANPNVLFSLFSGIKYNYYRLYLHFSYFDLWSQGFTQFIYILPYLLMGPSIFTGMISLGIFMQVTAAFSNVHSGFSVFFNNWIAITELRSIWKRLHEFEENIKMHGVMQAI